MKVIRIQLTLSLLLLLLVSCKKENNVLEPNAKNLLGYWIHPEYNDSIVSYERSSQFVNDYGCAFFPKNEFIERKNSGWCGTPPIAYADYEGDWSLNDSIISIKTTYWGGEMIYKWKIISISNDNLIVKTISIDLLKGSD